MSTQNAVPSDDGRTKAASNHLLQIPVTVDIIVGHSRMTISHLMALNSGAVIPLDRKIGELSDISVNGRVIAKGNIVVIDENKDDLGICITQILQPTGAIA